MQIVPIKAVPSQQVQCQLSGQAVTVNIFQQAYGLYVDVLVGVTPIIQGVIAEDRNRIVRDAYLGFSGDFFFLDVQGITDPIYMGLGVRYQLIYATAAEVAALGG